MNMPETFINSVTFFYPSKVVGGVEYLFIRLAKELKKFYQVNYVDFPDGFAKTKLIDCDVTFYDYSPTELITLPNGTCVITPLSSIVDLCFSLDMVSNVRVLFWSVQPSGLTIGLKGYNRYPFFSFETSKFKYGDSLTLLHRKRGLLFMDGENYIVQKRTFQFEIHNPSYLPIPIDVVNCEVTSGQHDLTIGWLGRLSKEKIFALINVLENAIDFVIDSGRSIIFYVIGDGDCSDLIDGVPGIENIDIIRIGTITDEQLRNTISENIDVLFAMGTSALEGARLKVPTVLVDLSNSQIPKGNNFRWLYESDQFSLANDYPHDFLYPHTFKNIMNSVEENTSRDLQGKLCYSYFMKNHEMSNIVRGLVRHIGSVRVTLKDIKKSNFKNFVVYGKIRRILKKIL